jgi:hypothetical protein
MELQVRNFNGTRRLADTLSFDLTLAEKTVTTPFVAPPARADTAASHPALSPETMATLRSLVAAQVGPSWMEWFDMTPGQRAAALAATPTLTSELRDGA